jgi:hypothetical protein
MLAYLSGDFVVVTLKVDWLCDLKIVLLDTRFCTILIDSDKGKMIPNELSSRYKSSILRHSRLIGSRQLFADFADNRLRGSIAFAFGLDSDGFGGEGWMVGIPISGRDDRETHVDQFRPAVIGYIEVVNRFSMRFEFCRGDANQS